MQSILDAAIFEQRTAHSATQTQTVTLMRFLPAVAASEFAARANPSAQRDDGADDDNPKHGMV
ncbi:MAG TPA: hypothetical protein VIK18_18190, partial [Pirellulales bacterium]